MQMRSHITYIFQNNKMIIYHTSFVLSQVHTPLPPHALAIVSVFIYKVIGKKQCKLEEKKRRLPMSKSTKCIYIALMYWFHLKVCFYFWGQAEQPKRFMSQRNLLNDRLQNIGTSHFSLRPETYISLMLLVIFLIVKLP